jgi:hypothetical protein
MLATNGHNRATEETISIDSLNTSSLDMRRLPLSIGWSTVKNRRNNMPFCTKRLLALAAIAVGAIGVAGEPAFAADPRQGYIDHQADHATTERMRRPFTVHELNSAGTRGLLLRCDDKSGDCNSEFSSTFATHGNGSLAQLLENLEAKSRANSDWAKHLETGARRCKNAAGFVKFCANRADHWLLAKQMEGNTFAFAPPRSKYDEIFGVETLPGKPKGVWIEPVRRMLGNIEVGAGVVEGAAKVVEKGGGKAKIFWSVVAVAAYGANGLREAVCTRELVTSPWVCDAPSPSIEKTD